MMQCVQRTVDEAGDSQEPRICLSIILVVVFVDVCRCHCIIYDDPHPLASHTPADHPHLRPGYELSVLSPTPLSTGESPAWLLADLDAVIVFPSLRHLTHRLIGPAPPTATSLHAADAWTAVAVLRRAGDPPPACLDVRWPSSLLVGAHVLVRSSPYALQAPELLLDTHAAGIVSSLLPHPSYATPALALVDAPCLPGAAGALVTHATCAVGMVLPHVHVADQHHLFSFVLLWPALEAGLARVWPDCVMQASTSAPDASHVPPSKGTRAMRSVVGVTCGGQFGSGVVVQRCVQ